VLLVYFFGGQPLNFGLHNFPVFFLQDSQTKTALFLTLVLLKLLEKKKTCEIGLELLSATTVFHFGGFFFQYSFIVPFYERPDFKQMRVETETITFQISGKTEIKSLN